MKILSTAPKNDARIEVASMVTSVTSVSPIISAAAVRAGALRVPGRVLAREDPGRAREPVARHAEHGARSAGSACEVKSATPTKTSTAPTPMNDEDRAGAARAQHARRRAARKPSTASAAEPIGRYLREATGRQRRAFAHGRDRRHRASRAAPGRRLAIIVTSDPDDAARRSPCAA